MRSPDPINCTLCIWLPHINGW